MQEPINNAFSTGINAGKFDKKPWVTPEVSESPVNEITSNNTPTPGSFDGATYS